MNLSSKEEEQIEKGLEITFMHLREILENPDRIAEYADGTQFIPVYLKEEGREALLLGIKPPEASVT